MTYYFTSLFKKSDVRITQGYSTTHKALDLSRGVVKQPIYSPNKLGSGTVTKIGTSYTSGGVLYKNTLIVGIKYDNGIYIEMYHGEVGDKVVSLNQRVVVGQQIYRTGNTGKSFGDHLHILMKNSSGIYMNPFDLLINDNIPNPAFKVGDKVIYTGIQNIRIGAGDKFKISRATTIGEIATIKDGPRTSQNKQFNLGENDSYTWWDMTFSNGSGWVADVNKFKRYIEPVISEPIPPVESPDTPNCEEYIKKVFLLSEENDTLKIKARDLEKELADAKEQIRIDGTIMEFHEQVKEEDDNKIKLLEERATFLESTMAIRDAELKETENDLIKTKEERDRFEKQYIEVVTELNELKKGRDDWINRLADMLHKLFGMK